jgi:ribokinase
MAELLIVGAASLDRLHFKSHQMEAAGGAGMYTAAAAHYSGATVTLYAPRPVIIPEALEPLVARVNWIGPQIESGQLPRFEIAHYGEGRAELLAASWGDEAAFAKDELPEDLSLYSYVHIAALESAQCQREFYSACVERGAVRTSIGTYARIVRDEGEVVRSLFKQADAFFMNENEAIGLFGSVDDVVSTGDTCVFVTLGERGALVIQGDQRSIIPSPLVDELDPTGAGDSFCGATLAGMAAGLTPEVAAREATALAAQMITGVGPEVLWKVD